MPDPSPSRPRVLGGKELAVLVLVVLVVVGMMAPIIWRTYQTSLAVRCRAHLAEIYEAVRHYAQNHGGCPPCHGAPPGADWRRLVEPHLDRDERRGGPRAVWECPAGGPYVGNRHLFTCPGRRLGSIRLDREVGVVADGTPQAGREGASDFAGVDWRHRDGANVIFVDGHIAWVPRAKSQWTRRHWNQPQ